MIAIPEEGWSIVPVKRINRDGSICWVEPLNEEFCHRDLVPAELTASGIVLWVNRGRIQRFGGWEIIAPRGEVRDIT
jgi:hypothetical protein